MDTLLTTKHELQRSILNLDPLTETANRADMLTKLREEQALARRKAHSTCIAMVDLDNFKSINDKYGHTVGDQVLVRFTHHMRSRMRSHDTIFRYGGEEFLICTPNTELEAGQAKMELLGKELAEIVIHREGHPPFTTTASFGVTVIDPDVSVQLSIERADKALYAAKAAGRNRTVIWSPSLTKRPAMALTNSSASIGGASIETSIINFSKSCRYMRDAPCPVLAIPWNHDSGRQCRLRRKKCSHKPRSPWIGGKLRRSDAEFAPCRAACPRSSPPCQDMRRGKISSRGFGRLKRYPCMR